MPRDIYRSFKELAASQRENDDWRRVVVRRHSPFAVIAPHGGGIESGTSEIAIAIAGRELSLYCFEGLKRRGNQILHITSTRFDDPVCLELLSSVQVAITIHGCAERSEVVRIGGRHEQFCIQTAAGLSAAGFQAAQDAADFSGEDSNNVCNRGQTGMGVQLEISRGLRARMFAGLEAEGRRVKTTEFHAFVSAVQCALRK